MTRELQNMPSGIAWSVLQRLFALTRASYIHPLAHLRHASRLTLGRHCQIYAGAVLSCQGVNERPMIIEDYVIVRENAYVDAHGGWIRLGSGVFVGQGTMIFGQGGVTVGINTMLAPAVKIFTAAHGIEKGNGPMKFQSETVAEVSIGSDCWIGAGAIILSGVSIGSGAVVGAGAVVTRDVPPLAKVMGAPAQVSGYR